jgi:hypothetical protein
MRLKHPTRFVRVSVPVTNKETGETYERLEKQQVVDVPTVVSVEGQQFEVDPEGTVELPDLLAARLLKDGWTPAPAKAVATKPAQIPLSGGQDPGKGKA